MPRRRILAASLTGLMVAFVPFAAHSSSDKVGADCTYKGFKLYGKVQVVQSFPDLKVQVVESFPDLKVKHVEHFADSCGEWRYVENFPDLKIQYVNSFPDIKVKYVEHFPGPG